MLNFLIIPNCLKEETAAFALQLTNLLHWRGQRVSMLPEHARFTGASCDSLADPVHPQGDVVVILGGDGTVLANMHKFDLFDVPFFGVNFGRIGYLTECEPVDAPRFIDAILSQTSFIEERIVLEGRINGPDGTEQSFLGFNEAVIHRASLNRALKFSVSVNGNSINQFSGDGILVATPTGSTAYNISAGGPVLMPASDCFVITPVCSQFRANCPLVVPGEDSIEITVLPVLRTGDNDDDQPLLEIDSFQRFVVEPGTTVRFFKSDRRARMIKIGKDSFYAALKKKLSASSYA